MKQAVTFLNKLHWFGVESIEQNAVRVPIDEIAVSHPANEAKRPPADVINEQFSEESRHNDSQFPC